MSRLFAAAALAATISVLASCADGGDRDATSGPSTSPSATSAASTVLPPCPRAEPVEPRVDGLPPLRLACLGDGPDVRLSDLRGTPTVVNVWAAWCTNCDREMPLFTQLQERAGDQIRLFGVHYKAPRGFALQSAADFGVTFPSVHDEDGDAVAAELKVRGPPTTLFVKADGMVAGRKIGEIKSYAELSRLVRQYLGVAV